MRQIVNGKEMVLGTCYYPEHWPESLWEEDLERMLECGIQVIRIAEFAWSKVEPYEGVFTYEFFDRFLDLAREKGLRFSSGGTVWLNAAFGALYNERELLENHEPMTQPMGECLSVKPEEKNGRLYLPDIEGGPIRLNLEKLEREGVIESVRYFYVSDAKQQFAVRGSY